MDEFSRAFLYQLVSLIEVGCMISSILQHKMPLYNKYKLYKSINFVVNVRKQLKSTCKQGIIELNFVL